MHGGVANNFISAATMRLFLKQVELLQIFNARCFVLESDLHEGPVVLVIVCVLVGHDSCGENRTRGTGRGETNDWINALQSLQCGEAVIAMIAIHWKLIAMICTIAHLAKK